MRAARPRRRGLVLDEDETVVSLLVALSVDGCDAEGHDRLVPVEDEAAQAALVAAGGGRGAPVRLHRQRRLHVGATAVANGSTAVVTT